MSNIVELINDGLTTRVASVLGITYSELPYVFDISLNSFKDGAKRYGVIPRPGSSVPGTNQFYTIDQLFQIQLTDVFVNRDGDAQANGQREILLVLYSKMDDIFKDILLTNINVNGVLLVGDPSLDEPEFIDEVAVLTATVVVKYNQQV